ncbi:MAG TPA: AIM24 family protein, partial [Pseudoduganella sp.]
MPVFTITGEEDPFLHVTLRQGEKIYCEANAMVMMESALELKGKMNGGLGAALMRTFANGESFFQQHIEAVKGDGDCLLSPTLPGAMQVLDVGQRQYMISDGAFVAATSGVNLNVRTQNVGTALFGQTGGFFITETSGSGQLVVS